MSAVSNNELEINRLTPERYQTTNGKRATILQQMKDDQPYRLRIRRDDRR